MGLDELFHGQRASHLENVRRLARERARPTPKAQFTALEALEARIDRKRRLYAQLQGFGRRGASRLTLRVAGEITADSIARLIVQLHDNPHAKIVEVLIDSEGGVADAAVKAYVALTGHPGRVQTVARGLCASAAATVFAAGHIRRARATTEFLLHRCAIEPCSSDKRWTATRLAVHARAVRDADEATMACLMRTCDRQRAEIAAHMTDANTSAGRMMALGLVTQFDRTPAELAGIERAWKLLAVTERMHARGSRS